MLAERPQGNMAGWDAAGTLVQTRTCSLSSLVELTLTTEV
jgi:hypothetical protein